MKKHTQLIKLSANENCYGCSPAVLEVIRKKYKEVNRYPELIPSELIEKLAAKFGVQSENIVVGAGSVRIIDGLIQTLVSPEEEIITFEKSFIAYSQLAALHKRKCHLAPLTRLRCLPMETVPLINSKTRLIFIANPNNPTGTIITHSELEMFLKKISPNILVILDEAYAEYVNDPLYPVSTSLQEKYPNLVILRSFSKIFGLAGLRVGFAILDSSLASRLNEGSIPYSLNFLASSSALAAMDDRTFVMNCSKSNSEQRDYLTRELLSHEFSTIPSQTNFIYLEFRDEMEKENIFDLLNHEGIKICNLSVFGIEKALRITVGTPEVNQRVVRILSKAEKMTL